MAAPSSTETREFLSCACTCAPYWPEEELNGESSFHPEKVINSKDYIGETACLLEEVKNFNHLISQKRLHIQGLT